MSTIIVGYFSNVDQINDAKKWLNQMNVTSDDYATYFLNPPGAHGLYQLGGDAPADEGAAGAGKEAAKGATVGGAAGLAAGAVGGPVGALVGAGAGAYLGSLMGAMRGLDDPDPDQASKERPAEPPAGPVMALNVGSKISADEAVKLFRERGAVRIDLTTGRWSAGEWTDFDPREPVETVYRSDKSVP